MKRTLLLILPPLVVFTFIFTFFSFVISEKACDYLMSFHPKKLAAFDHKKHLSEYGADSCETCHGYYDNGRFKGIPTAGDCRSMCHDGSTAPVREDLKNFKDNEKPWEAYARQPDLVYFSHKVVMTSPKVSRCASCHGNKEKAVNTEKIQGKMLMGKCMDCHTARKISNSCAVCHD